MLVLPLAELPTRTKLPLALSEKPPDYANDKTKNTYHHCRRSQQYRKAWMTKHRIGIIDTTRFQMGGEYSIHDDELGDCNG